MIDSKELLQYTKGLSLLFVEDHEELRVNTTEILKNFFKKIDSAENGEEALTAYKKSVENSKAYDIVITDIRMPKMDGILLTEKIYELKQNQIVIVLSAHDEVEYLLPLINLGIEQFIKKPIDYQELLSVLLKITKNQNSTQKSNFNQIEINLDQNLTYNRETKLLIYNTENIYLTKFEIIFLQQLTTQVGRIYSNENIVEYFNTLDELIDAQNIRKLVSKLRKKLPKNSLESIYGVGYRIVS